MVTVGVTTTANGAGVSRHDQAVACPFLCAEPAMLGLSADDSFCRLVRAAGYWSHPLAHLVGVGEYPVKYRTIVVDPPWHYESWPGPMSRKNPVPHGPWSGPFNHVLARRRKAIDYPTMSSAEIAALPVADMAELDCHLYLWTTNRYLPDAFGVLKTWGFRYSQTLVWAKTPMGLGPGGTFAQNAEFCLFARRGSLKHLRRSETVWFNWPRMGPGSHSRKPEHFIDMVEQVSPGPYVELFSRRHRMGWDVHGFESANTAQWDPVA